MSNLNENLISKKQKERNGDPPNKRRKYDTPDKPVDSMHITDVNDDCLEHIFKYLKVSDLLNLSDTSKLLNNAVRLAFESKYGKHAVRLGTWGESKKHRRIIIKDKEIAILNFPTCLKMLRCFGDSITKLTTPDKYVPVRERDELNLYLDEYCADSLVEFKYGRRSLKHLAKPFTKVETAHFHHVQFQSHPADINRCFPNLRNLTLNKPPAVASLTGLLSHLEHLQLYLSINQRTNFAMFLRRNPQLRSIRIIGYDLGSKFLRILSKHPQIENLYLEEKKDTNLTFISSDTAPIIIFKTVRKFETFSLYFTLLSAADIPISFDQLDELTINGPLNKSVSRFISFHPSIKTFTWITSAPSNEKETLLYLAKIIPSVTEVRLQRFLLSAGSVLDFMKECHLLKKLEFRIKSRAEYNEYLRKKLRTEWQSSINDSNIVKLER